VWKGGREGRIVVNRQRGKEGERGKVEINRNVDAQYDAIVPRRGERRFSVLILVFVFVILQRYLDGGK
jgi:hypothetical protein